MDKTFLYMNDKTLIACCGLDCEACEARKATLNNDDDLRREVSRKWCEMNHTDQITPETINCLGCRSDGVKFAYCEYMCTIRKCCIAKGFSTCAACAEKASCKHLMPFIDNETGSKNLGL